MRHRMNWSHGTLPAIGVAVLFAASYVGAGETRGTVTPTAHSGGVTLAIAHANAAVAAAAQQAPAGLDYDVYKERVEPVLLRDRGGYGPGLSACVTCHVQSGTPMRLQPLEEDANGGVYWAEAQSRSNFDVVSALVTPGEPGESRLLQAPLELSGGGSGFHLGGKFWQTRDEPDWQALASWVSAAEAVAAAAAPAEVDFEFFRSCVQQIFLDREQETHRMECAACHGSGVRGFAQDLPDGRDFWDEQESRANFALLTRFVEPGDPLGSRFLTHPLDSHDRGDNYHSGGRRWHSQDDPEWQMLAAWVNGETPECVVEDR